MSSKLELANELAAVDDKDRGYYDSLDEQERKKFSSYVLLKYAANVEGSRDLQEYYLLSASEQNKNFWDLNRHPKMQWLAVTAISPGVGRQRHYWLKAAKSGPTGAKAQRLRELFPNARDYELEILDAINSDDDLRDYEDASGTQTSGGTRSRRRK